ncbi:hypothetical protein LX87_02988 [Larkinella arboricola]|uniref:Uncharacterized protein n=1 Tax=Larkinella arboricola TaxID=643671 RepID=A0A327WZS5_LARAB|nr:hypothetical protein [Larkinella arboricola]RAJ98080.1 hypothetical protein LX87_02988 [Larkinella arboricola]
MQEELNLDQLRQKILRVSGTELIKLQSFLECEIQRRKQILGEIPAITLDQIPLRVQTRTTFYSVVRRRKICDLAEVGQLTLSETLALLKPADLQSLKSLNQRSYNELITELGKLNIPHDYISLWDQKMIHPKSITGAHSISSSDSVNN